MASQEWKSGAFELSSKEVREARGHGQFNEAAAPWWNPKYWQKRVWAIVVAIIVVIAIVVGAVVGTQVKKNAYPDYTELSYSLAETYGGENFFDKFDYFTGYDPTGGFVHYVPQAQAEQLNLTYASPSTAVLRVDTSVGPGSEPDASTGRFSVRVTSKNTYNSGLFLFDVKHTPYGCGTWPALWLVDPSNWPQHGEIDVFEAVNQADDGNQMTLHTSPGCSMDVRRKQIGDAEHSTCDSSKNENAGCGVQGESDSYGVAFNQGGGGVMALEWRDAGIRMWQFARGAIPADVTSKTPNPATWGTALADFPNTNCDIGNHFKNQSIVANIDLCGHLVYAVYGESGCPSNCTDYVANNPTAFRDAYWEFGSFEVYQASN
ncbi:putative glycosidase [Paramyrothecium foliicola]|nr:putative glycosidase [Paramyrothecium foliicola]